VFTQLDEICHSHELGTNIKSLSRSSDYIDGLQLHPIKCASIQRPIDVSKKTHAEN